MLVIFENNKIIFYSNKHKQKVHKLDLRDQCSVCMVGYSTGIFNILTFVPPTEVITNVSTHFKSTLYTDVAPSTAY